MPDRVGPRDLSAVVISKRGPHQLARLAQSLGCFALAGAATWSVTALSVTESGALRALPDRVLWLLGAW